MAEPGEPLAGYTTLRLGGPARRLLHAGSREQLVEAVRDADRDNEPVLLLAGGSNLVICDDGFPGTAVRIATRGIDVQDAGPTGVRVTVQAGEPWDAFVAGAVEQGWVGVEALSGIPGSVGATPIQNVGAYGQEVAETVVSVRCWDRVDAQPVEIPAAECGFGYRTSRFKRDPRRFLVLAVVFEFERGGLGAPVRYPELARRLGVETGQRVPLASVRRTVLALRAGKGMVLDPDDHDTWSAGSFFTNPLLDADQAARLPDDAPRWPQADGTVKTSAAWLIERAGFSKGYGDGRAALSGKHTLALTNRGEATTADLLELAGRIRAGVQDRFGIRLVNEPVLVGCELP
ncbi:MAG TPA: UDP-N-acetylmuramate dehydrogenase [Nocardioidaceae bacterium]|nr:UDP-N-acetylmuramate dehydrogenase [Nocardioidaceae bacterium]